MIKPYEILNGNILNARLYTENNPLINPGDRYCTYINVHDSCKKSTTEHEAERKSICIENRTVLQNGNGLRTNARTSKSRP